MCEDGWAGADCSVPTCPSHCGGNGFCFQGACYCRPGFMGHDCSLKACPNECSNKGVCENYTCM